MPTTNRRTFGAVASCLLAGWGLLAACGDDDAGSTDSFCEQVQANEATLFTWNWASLNEVEQNLDVARDIGGDAPLAIDAHWDAYVLLLETAVESADEQEILARAYASERSMVEIGDWVEANCGVAIPIGTLPPLDAPTLGGTEPPTTAG